MEDQWFYTHAGKRHGPVVHAELCALATQGELRRLDQCWKKGMAKWEPAGEVLDVFADLPPDLEPEVPAVGEIPLPSTSGMKEQEPGLPADQLRPSLPSKTGPGFRQKIAQNKRALVLLSIFVILLFGLGVPSCYERMTAPQRKAEHLAELHALAISQNVQAGRTAGGKFAEAGRVTALFRASTEREIRALAALAWDHAEEPSYYRIVGSYGSLKPAGGYIDHESKSIWNTPEMKDFFADGFLEGYVAYMRQFRPAY